MVAPTFLGLCFYSTVYPRTTVKISTVKNLYYKIKNNFGQSCTNFPRALLSTYYKVPQSALPKFLTSILQPYNKIVSMLYWMFLDVDILPNYFNHLILFFLTAHPPRRQASGICKLTLLVYIASLYHCVVLTAVLSSQTVSPTWPAIMSWFWMPLVSLRHNTTYPIL